MQLSSERNYVVKRAHALRSRGAVLVPSGGRRFFSECVCENLLTGISTTRCGNAVCMCRVYSGMKIVCVCGKCARKKPLMGIFGPKSTAVSDVVVVVAVAIVIAIAQDNRPYINASSTVSKCTAAYNTVHLTNTCDGCEAQTLVAHQTRSLLFTIILFAHVQRAVPCSMGHTARSSRKLVACIWVFALKVPQSTTHSALGVPCGCRVL